MVIVAQVLFVVLGAAWLVTRPLMRGQAAEIRAELIPRLVIAGCILLVLALSLAGPLLSPRLAWPAVKGRIAKEFPSVKRVSTTELAKELDLSLIHISEPTRLLSISYAVFCLKKK